VQAAQKLKLRDGNDHITPEVQTLLHAFMQNTTITSLKGNQIIYLADHLEDILFANIVGERLLPDGTHELFGSKVKAGTERGYAHLASDGTGVKAAAATNLECPPADEAANANCLPVMNVYLKSGTELSQVLAETIRANAVDAFGAYADYVPEYRNVPIHISYVH
jgi:hypothetical protein